MHTWNRLWFRTRNGMWVGDRVWERSTLQDNAIPVSKAVVAAYALTSDTLRHPIDLSSSELGITRCLNYSPSNGHKFVSLYGLHLHFLIIYEGFKKWDRET